jgi:serine/threonine protein kinase
MAPELLLNYVKGKLHGKYNFKCDIWPIGLIAYELVAGQIPWILPK